LIQEKKTKILVLLSVGIAWQIGFLLLTLGLERSPLQILWKGQEPLHYHHIPGIILHLNHDELVVLVWSCILLGDILFLWGCVLLAQARGYSGAIAAAAWACGCIVRCFIPFIPAVLPLAVILVLPDKNRVRSRRGRPL
jgi:hypothetical protein